MDDPHVRWVEWDRTDLVWWLFEDGKRIGTMDGPAPMGEPFAMPMAPDAERNPTLRPPGPLSARSMQIKAEYQAWKAAQP